MVNPQFPGSSVPISQRFSSLWDSYNSLSVLAYLQRTENLSSSKSSYFTLDGRAPRDTTTLLFLGMNTPGKQLKYWSPAMELPFPFQVCYSDLTLYANISLPRFPYAAWPLYQVPALHFEVTLFHEHPIGTSLIQTLLYTLVSTETEACPPVVEKKNPGTPPFIFQSSAPLRAPGL